MPNARTLCKSMTDAERRLWSLLRDRQLGGHKFRRQHPLGSYVLDFACVGQQLAVEVDGGQHANSEHDRQRTSWLEEQGWRVLRFWNNEVLTNAEGVIRRIAEALRES
ncbi:endonuclease domain-containing protein [Ferrovibrio sp.]|uniref:endonuclease domain-containing protein n=1 Tax=Ferrovibrio sp. TaxID=1917215 RepID=UPI000CC7093A|nr:endonuclease domain-containing protein [Ferrovibrio sp.]PJI42448.1 MAG: DNA methyltransferase [Ferrovibrio sp.]